MRFKGKKVLITGGASGLGAVTALRFAEEGAHVVIVDRNVTMGNKVIRQIQDGGGSSLFVEVDLADDESIQRCARSVYQNISALHVLVNNAGIKSHTMVENFNQGEWEPMVSIHLKAPALVAQAFLPLMKQQMQYSYIQAV